MAQSCPPALGNYCVELNKFVDRSDKLDTKIYIVAGVLGAVSAVLILALIILAVKFHKLRRQLVGHQRSHKPQTPPSPNIQRSLPPQVSSGREISESPQLPTFTSGQSIHHQQNQLITQQHNTHAVPTTNMSNGNNNKGMASSAEEELAQLGFSAYTGHQHQNEPRGISPNAGAVRVLPRNPPTSFRQNAGFNEGYM